jgi:hypothetical protein
MRLRTLNSKNDNQLEDLVAFAAVVSSYTFKQEMMLINIKGANIWVMQLDAGSRRISDREPHMGLRAAGACDGDQHGGDGGTETGLSPGEKAAPCIHDPCRNMPKLLPNSRPGFILVSPQRRD